MDDLLVVAPDKKLYGQIISTILIIFGSGIMINSLSGLFGIYELPYFVGVAITLFIFIALINAYNLIDGIDGLAPSIGIFICLCFVYIFYRIYDYAIGILAISTMATLIGFVRYNLSNRYRIFMGDTGSMVIGFILTFMAIRFLYVSNETNSRILTAPVLLLFIFVVPIVDTSTVFITRILQGKHPLKPDKSHLHHQLLSIGYSHVKTSIILVIINVIFVLIGYNLRKLEINQLFLIFIALSFSFVLTLKLYVNHCNVKKTI